jgi:hypothetical protein
MNVVVGMPRARRIRHEGKWIALVLGVLSLVTIVLLLFIYGPAYWAYASYQPQEGDVIFQSLPFSRIVTAIEGATDSPLSHCGIVAREDDRWVVYEAIGPVGPSPLGDYIARGRNRAFLVKRLRSVEQPHIPEMLAAVRALRGRPYDERYRLDDDHAYRDATGGKSLGKLVTLGELNWQPYQELIEQIEKAPPPLDRELITPRDLARARQLETAFSYGY